MPDNGNEKISDLRVIVESGFARVETQIEALKAEIQADRERTTDQLKAIESWRLGNGVVGATTRIDRLEQQQIDMKEKQKELEKKRDRRITVALGAGISGLLGATAMVIRFWLFGN